MAMLVAAVTSSIVVITAVALMICMANIALPFLRWGEENLPGGPRTLTVIDLLKIGAGWCVHTRTPLRVLIALC
jgi:hypothetical protein